MCKAHRALRGRVQRAGPWTGAVTLVQPGREGPGLWTMRKAPETAFLAPLGRVGAEVRIVREEGFITDIAKNRQSAVIRSYKAD